MKPPSVTLNQLRELNPELAESYLKPFPGETLFSYRQRIAGRVYLEADNADRKAQMDSNTPPKKTDEETRKLLTEELSRIGNKPGLLGKLFRR